jgi:hypothetical protein
MTAAFDMRLGTALEEKGEMTNSNAILPRFWPEIR